MNFDDIESDNSGRDRWLISYADMLTLLFAIFVFLYSLNQATKTEEGLFQFSSSMRAAFQPPFEDIPVKDRMAPKEAGMGVFENFKGNKLRPDLVETYPSKAGISPDLSSDMNKVKNNLAKLYGKYMSTEVGSSGLERILNIYETKEGFKLRLAGRFGFNAGKHTLDLHALGDLRELLAPLAGLDRKILIKGFTQSAEANLNSKELMVLSNNRAIYMFDKLVQAGMNANDLSIASYGPRKPLENSNPIDDINRRVEIHVKYND